MFDKVVIIDNSQILPAPAPLSASRPTAFFPVFSDRGFGKDSDLKLIRGGNQASLAANFGQPNLASTLEPMYYAYEFLRGGGDVYIRRIVSEISTTAHAVILAKGKVNVTTSAFEVQFVVQTVIGMYTHDTLIAAAEALATTVADVDGNKLWPIAVVGLNWSGNEGNKYTFRLLPDKNLEKVIAQRGYQLEVRKPSSTGPTTVSFAIDPDTLLDGSTVYANEYVEEQLPDVHFTMLSTYNGFLSAIASSIPVDETNVDIFFGKTKAGVAYPSYTILGLSVDFTAVGGIPLAGGDDGDFAAGATRIDNMYTRLIASFDEIPTQLLLNEYKYAIDYVFDFNAPQAVKDAIVAFANARLTTSAILDTNNTKTSSAILALRTAGSLTYNNDALSLHAGIATARDPFSQKKIIMPLSFFEAFATPNHIITYGGERPFAGNLYAYPNMLPGTYNPYFYSENTDVVESFVDNRLNFAMEDATQYSSFHQSTTLKLDGALLERNNVYLLHKLIRVGLVTARANRWNFAEDSDIALYEASLKQNIGVELEGKLGSFTLAAQREGLIGPARNRVLVTGEIRFKFLNKGTTFNFTIV
jgi:hypothetical protein